MSVIHEALKKTGHNITAGTPKPRKLADSAAFRGTVSVYKKTAPNWTLFLLLLVVALAGAPFWLGRIAGSADSGSIPSKALAQFHVEEIPSVPALNVGHAVQNQAGSPFLLSGVVLTGTESYCLINGLVLRPGGKVGGATIHRITADSVTLDLNGKRILLPAPTA